MRARLEHLEQSLNLKEIPIDCTGGWLEKLEILGIIRQGMLRRLNTLRNAIEHDGASAPEINICWDYEEVVWYFLKVTTPYIFPPTDEDMQPLDDEVALGDRIGFTYKVSYKPLHIRIDGRVYADALSMNPVADWLEILLIPPREVGLTENPARLVREGRHVEQFFARVADPPAQVKFLRDVFSRFF